MPGVKVLIVKLGPEDLLDGLVGELNSHPEIELVTAAPVSLDEAADFIRAQGRLHVVLLLGPDRDAREAATVLAISIAASTSPPSPSSWAGPASR